MLDPKVFKAYDVRGLYSTELDEDGAYRVGRAYVEHFEPRSIAVGRDMRLSSPTMAAAVIEGAADGGADVVDIGLVGTEMVYFAVAEHGLDGGICVTASHNPKDYTGMKIVRRGALPVGGDSGLAEIRERALAGFGRPPRGAARFGSWMSGTGSSTRCLSFIDPGFHPAASRGRRHCERDGGGDAPARSRAASAARRRQVQLRAGRDFPNHAPNPLLPENREFIVRTTREENADLGVAYDGDADRCFFVDDTGEFVPGDFVTALLARSILTNSQARR